VLYIDMRLVEGNNLHAELREKGPLDPARAASIVGQQSSSAGANDAVGLCGVPCRARRLLLPRDTAQRRRGYRIRQRGAVLGRMTIVPPDGQAITEPMVQYATS
jgi:hypothetical protein